MGVSYNKLFKLMIDRKIQKKDLQEAAGISPAPVIKFASITGVYKKCLLDRMHAIVEYIL